VNSEPWAGRRARSATRRGRPSIALAAADDLHGLPMREPARSCGPVLPSIAAGCRLTNSMVAMDEPARLAHADVNGSNACARRGPARLSTVSASRYESAFSCCVRTP